MDDTSKDAKFKGVGLSTFKDMMSQNFFSRKEQVIANRYLSPGIEQNSKKKSLFMLENIFPGTNLYISWF